MHDPFTVGPHQPVKHIAVNNQIAFAVLANMHFAIGNLDFAEIDLEFQKAAQKFVMISGDISHIAPALARRQYAADDISVRLRPEPFLLEPPAINDIPDQIERLGIVVFEKITERVGLTALGAEMDIGNKHRPIIRFRKSLFRSFARRPHNPRPKGIL